MDNYFTAQLKEFLSETANDIIIKNIKIWKKNNFIKLDITIKNKKTITNLGDCEKIHKLVIKWAKQQAIDDKTKISVLAESIDKVLFDFEDYNDSINEKVKIELKEKIDDRKNYTGFLIAVKNDKVVLNIENKKYELIFENIKKAQIIPNI